MNTDIETHELFTNQILELYKLDKAAIPDESDFGEAEDADKLPLTFGE